MDYCAPNRDVKSGSLNWWEIDLLFYQQPSLIHYWFCFCHFQVNDYIAAQDAAKKRHLNIWRYGDITEDDANEFGLGKRKI